MLALPKSLLRIEPQLIVVLDDGASYHITKGIFVLVVGFYRLADCLDNLLLFLICAGEIHSPTHLQLKFESFGGTKIDPDAVKVTYLRTPNVDLTSRVKSFVQASGIDIPDVELPVGDHLVRVDIKDSDGRVGSTSFVLRVAP
jgi:hypothetical protein